ncbi:MAG: molybdopterin cofactor-binding domain-containing protein [Gammaproteobacteria bacterium]
MISRRGFILSGAAAGGGLLLAYGAWRLDDGDAAQKFATSGRPAPALNAWIKIEPNGEIVCAIHRAEMGQGITTGLAQILIEELDADWSQARFEFSPVDRDYFNFAILEDGRPFGDPEASWWAGTGTWAMRQVMHAVGLSLTVASTSTIDAWDVVRPAGAAARQMLIGAAARRWQCDPASLRTEGGFVIDDAGGRKAGYGELAESAALETPPSDPRMKSRDEYRIIGRDMPRLDTPIKVRGSAVYASDIVLPDMLFASIAHSPVVGTKVASFDSNGAEAMPGVAGIVRAGDTAVAVVADNTWIAMEAADRIRVEAEAVDTVETRGLDARYFAKLDADERVMLREDPNTLDTISSASASITSEYAAPYLAHECMEPMSCVALYSGDALEVWVGSQSNSLSRDIAAAVSGLEKDRVTVHSTFMGGAFGRRSEMDFVEQAVAVAMQFPNRPIKLAWSRRQDLRHGAFRPAAIARVSGCLDELGNIAAIDYAVVQQSVSADYTRRTPSPRKVDDFEDRYIVAPVDKPLYRVDRLRTGYIPVIAHVPVGYWRSVSYTLNPFFFESFIDELAVEAGSDPLEFRRGALADNPRCLAVLDALEQAAGPLTTDGRGYAIILSHGTMVAHAIDVAVTGGKFARVERVTCAIDCGLALHPDNVVAQTEGCIFDGLAVALDGRIDIRAGKIRQQFFSTYAQFRLDQQPQIDVRIVPSDNRPGGVGEAAIPGVAPALCNAIFAATGERIRRLPVRTRDT